MAASGASPRRRNLAFLSIAISVAIVFFIGFGSFMALTRGPSDQSGTEAFGLFVFVAGFACLAGAFLLAPRGGTEVAQGPRITSDAVVTRAFRAMLLSTWGAFLGLMGTFMTSRPSLVLVLGAGALAAIQLWIVPRGGRLLDDLERSADAPAPGPA
jgi:hypothetical protein